MTSIPSAKAGCQLQRVLANLAHETSEDRLNKMGIGFDFSDGRYYRIKIDSIKKVGKRSSQEFAFYHPDFKKMAAEAKAGGYDIVVDSEQPRHSSLTGYLSYQDRVIHLKPTASFETFHHEFDHYRFMRTLESAALRARTAGFGLVAEGKHPKDFLFWLSQMKEDDFFKIEIERNPELKNLLRLYEKERFSNTEEGFIAALETSATRSENLLLKGEGRSAYSLRVLYNEWYGSQHRLNMYISEPFKKMSSERKIAFMRELAKFTALTASIYSAPPCLALFVGIRAKFLYDDHAEALHDFYRKVFQIQPPKPLDENDDASHY